VNNRGCGMVNLHKIYVGAGYTVSFANCPPVVPQTLGFGRMISAPTIKIKKAVDKTAGMVYNKGGERVARSTNSGNGHSFL